MMKCFVFRSHKDLSQNVSMRPERIVIFSALLLFSITYLNFQWQAQNVLIISYLYGLLRWQEMILRYAEWRRVRWRQRMMRGHPYYRTLPRPAESWFEVHYYDHTIPEDLFWKQLRMGRLTFQLLLDILAGRLSRQNTRFRNCIPPEKVLAIGLFRLAHGNSYISTSPAMNVGKSTVVEAVQDVVEGLYDLWNEYIKFPETGAETASTVETFEELSSLPNMAGAIDGTHVWISAPKGSAADYFSHYQQYDFPFQGVVDGKMLFTDFLAGFPGSLHDARALRNSVIFQRAENQEILTDYNSNWAWSN